MRIAVLLTCFNRKSKTLECLNLFEKAKEKLKTDINFEIFLTDDSSTDGTSEAVNLSFPKVKILSGTGYLYWAGGMKNSFKHARKKDFDGYLLLNDDTNLFKSSLTDLIASIEKLYKDDCSKFILVGSTHDANKIHSYGGAVYTNRFKAVYKELIPNQELQQCELGNANFMYVTKDTINQIGFLYKGYQHGVADYDYTLLANSENINVFILPDYIGVCNNHEISTVDKFNTLRSIKERFRFIINPIGFAFKDNLIFQMRFFKHRVPFIVLAAMIRLISPKVYTYLFSRN